VGVRHLQLCEKGARASSTPTHPRDHHVRQRRRLELRQLLHVRDVPGTGFPRRTSATATRASSCRRRPPSRPTWSTGSTPTRPDVRVRERDLLRRVIVRKDGKFHVPFALNKASSGFEGFGDAVLTSDRARSSVFRRPQITVSRTGASRGQGEGRRGHVRETSGSERSRSGRSRREALRRRRLPADRHRGSGTTTTASTSTGAAWRSRTTPLLPQGNNLSLYDMNSAYRDHGLQGGRLVSGTANLLQSASRPLDELLGQPPRDVLPPLAPRTRRRWPGSSSSWARRSRRTTILTTSAIARRQVPPDFSVYHYANFTR